jgi:hypothetical protein
MKHYTRHAGKVMVKGSMYNKVVGSRAEVWHGCARKTSGGLTKKDLMKNKSGRLVSKTKHTTAKKEKRLLKAGYGTKKGKFGAVKLFKGKSKKMRGGYGGVNYSLSPSEISGITQTSGVDLQFVAGNAA